ncbi:Rha family transcriptional regulator [Thalassospira sp. MCCC 1A01428]|uniref:Rha family transcriptional regulator n=1 Tax=Thalassospira sp. MCCC 1A01428 TaxID=1470575 RepID=UPI000A1E5C62|nr:Rha family transcriptional regulator [Thalassospira sp. MCCC 1A01428]
MKRALNVSNDNSVLPVVFEKGGAIKTNSRDVAAYFGKLHKNVLRDIGELECSDDFRRLNFEPTSHDVEMPNGGRRTERSFNMTKDGFTFLAMGFTGKSAAGFKETYIAQFNAMENTLRAIPEELVRALGIVKTVVKKVTAIEHRMTQWEARLEGMRQEQSAATLALAEQVGNLMLGASARVAALEYVSVRELLLEYSAVQKGRSALNRKIGCRLRARALQSRPPVAVRRCPHSGVWLFPRDFANDYMRRSGSFLVREHNDNQTGQGRLHLIVGGKAQAKGAGR